MLLTVLLLVSPLLTSCSVDIHKQFAAPGAASTLAQTELPGTPRVSPQTATPAPSPTPSPAPTAPPEKVKIGISLPSESMEHWKQDGHNMAEQLVQAGYSSILQYANNNAQVQAEQISGMITKGCKILVIAAVSASSLSDVLETAAENNVTVIAFDRLITQTPNVDYYIAFDNNKTGELQGQYIRDQLKLDSEAGPFTIEIFAGNPMDTNATIFYNGAMSVLAPYIASGKLVIESGQQGFDQVATANWSSAAAQTRMNSLLDANYQSGRKLDAILSPNDSLAIGILASLAKHGFGTAAKPYPIITGQDCSVNNVKAIIAGRQSMSVFKDTKGLVENAVEMITAIENGQVPPTNDSKTYDNGVKVVPAWLVSPVIVTKDNYKAILVDGGYYTAKQLK
jgi:putative multiple sugar transport system substrate-binding protein